MTERFFYTKDEYETAIHTDIIAYLKFVGHKLTDEGKNYVRSKEHSSLIIRKNDGAWSWNKRNENGRNPVSLVSRLLQTDQAYDSKTAYITAVKNLAAFSGYAQENNENYSITSKRKPITAERQTEMADRVLQMPEKSSDYKRSIAYLCQTRRIDYDIVKKLSAEKKILQEAKTNNVGFVAYDATGQARHVFLRGTMSEKNFKKDAPGSDKSYAFCFGGREESKRVYVFEAAIDALSHATLAKRCSKETGDYRITLNGISSEGLDRFLSEHKNVKEIVLCTDNDVAGEKCAARIIEDKKDSYRLLRQRVPEGKDWNEYLVNHVPERCPNEMQR